MDIVYCIKGTYEHLHCIFWNNPSTLPHICYLVYKIPDAICEEYFQLHVKRKQLIITDNGLHTTPDTLHPLLNVSLHTVFSIMMITFLWEFYPLWPQKSN